MPCAGVLAAKDIPGPPPERFHDVGWSSVLAEVVHGDRGKSVGGTLHPRPAVPRASRPPR
jgi:hypothetical protein